jgi:predicted ATP-binding protein involved in virulence
MARSRQQSAVYFSSLELENVRCFGERQVLELTDDKGRPVQWTLLLGDNGVGKTTLLQCLAWMRPVPAGLPPGTEKEPEDVEPALTNEENDVFNSLLRAGAEVTLDLKATLSIGKSFEETKRGSRKIETGIRMWGKHGRLQDHELTTNSFPRSIKSLARFELPIFAYGAARHMGVSNLDKSELADPLASLFSSAIELYDAEEILLNLDYLAAKSRKPCDQKRLQQVKQLLATLLPDISDEESIEILGPKVLGRPDEPSGVRFDTPYGRVQLSGLSLGYQTTLAWALDLATRLYARYPDSPDPLAEPAIVLVDEIDLHLHPRWQRQIMTYLTQHFPNIQFIATAHSPLMVQAATKANLVVLQQKDGQVEIENRPQFVESWRVDQILTSELFGVPARSPRIQGLIEERYKLLDKRRQTPSDEQRLRELDAELDHLPTANHDDNEAMELIRQAAALIKRQ